MARRHEIPPENVVFFLGSAIPVENGGIEFGEFLVGTSLPESLEVEHSFISSFYRQLLDRSDHVGKVIAPVQGLVVE